MGQWKQGTTPVVTFPMVDSTDHFSAKTGLSVAVTLSKAGAAFGAAAGAVAEIATGWYKCTLTAADTGTLGELSFHCTSAGADPTDFKEQIVAFDPTDAAALGLSRLDAAISSRNSVAPPTAAAISTQVWTEPVPAAFGAGSSGNILGNRVDVAVSSRASGSVGGVVGSGSKSWPITVTKPDGVTPIEGVAVWVTTDSAGSNAVAGTLYTDTLGRINTTVGFMLDPGAYYLWRQHGLYNFANPTAFTVT